MKLLLAVLLVVASASMGDCGLVKRQTQGQGDIDSFWNQFGNNPITTTQKPQTTGSQLQRCLNRCPATNEYNPVCGNNGQQYQNIGKLNCAISCGVSVSVETRASCQALT